METITNLVIQQGNTLLTARVTRELDSQLDAIRTCNAFHTDRMDSQDHRLAALEQKVGLAGALRAELVEMRSARDVHKSEADEWHRRANKLQDALDAKAAKQKVRRSLCVAYMEHNSPMDGFYEAERQLEEINERQDALESIVESNVRAQDRQAGLPRLAGINAVAVPVKTLDRWLWFVKEVIRVYKAEGLADTVRDEMYDLLPPMSND